MYGYTPYYGNPMPDQLAQLRQNPMMQHPMQGMPQHVLRDIDINSLTYGEMEKVAHICSAVMALKYNPYEYIANIAKIKTEE